MNLQALSVPGGRGRVACARVAEFAADLASALRRAVPFLARRRILVTAEPPRCVSFADLAVDATIAYASAFSVGPAQGLILLDDIALARILDGVLGGEGEMTLTSATLSSAQNALAARISSGMLRAFGDVMSSRLGAKFEPRTDKKKNIESGSAAVVTLTIDGGGRVLVAIPISAIRVDDNGANSMVGAQKDNGPSSSKGKSANTIDPNLAAAMTEVEVDVIAELGKVRLSLETIRRLCVGDVIRLSLPLDERARVCAGGAVLFHGRPTASGDVVAVALERQVVQTRSG